MGDERGRVDRQADIGEQGPLHRGAVGDHLEPVIEEEGDAGIDGLGLDQLRDRAVGGHLGDLGAIDAVDLGDREPLLLGVAAQLHAELLAVEILQRFDPERGRVDDRRRAFLQDHRGGDDRQLAAEGHQGLVGRGIAELGGAVADQLDRHGRAFARHQIEVDALGGEEALLLRQHDRRVLRAIDPVEPEIDLVGGLRRAGDRQQSASNRQNSCQHGGLLVMVDHMVSGVDSIAACQDSVKRSHRTTARKKASPSALSTKIPANISSVSSEMLA